MVNQVKKVRKMLENVAIFWLFLRNFLAILAIKMNKIGYFGLSTVGNTGSTEVGKSHDKNSIQSQSNQSPVSVLQTSLTPQKNVSYNYLCTYHTFMSTQLASVKMCCFLTWLIFSSLLIRALFVITLHYRIAVYKRLYFQTVECTINDSTCVIIYEKSSLIAQK